MAYESITCPLCGDREDKGLFHDTVWGGDPEDVFLHCSQCDIVFLYPFPSDDALNSFYKNEFGSYMIERSMEMDWGNLEKQYNNLSQRELPLRKPFFENYLTNGTVVEIGSSTGFLLDYLRNNGIEAHGVEPSRMHAEFSESKGNVIFESIQSLEKSYDLGLHYYVLEHVPNPAVFLESCISKIKSGGHLIFEVPHRNDALLAYYNLSSYKNFILQKMHLFYYSISSLEFLLDSLGLDYEFVPGQRYGLKNHLHWLRFGKPGVSFPIINESTEKAYKTDLINASYFDYFVVIVKVK